MSKNPYKMYSLKVDNRCNSKKVKLKQSFVALKKKKKRGKKKEKATTKSKTKKEKLNFMNMCLSL